ncbi:MAG: hypothetical protein HY330_00330 [Chloroflexi bacterium]|nr:hypothetical protein [Chloroflexota bacterium]
MTTTPSGPVPGPDLRQVNQPQPWSAVVHGVPTRGEVLVADRWERAWERPQGARFRLVVLLPGAEPPRPEQVREGVVVCVPGHILQDGPAPYLEATPVPSLAAYAAGSLVAGGAGLPSPGAIFRDGWPEALERLAAALVEAESTWDDAQGWAQALFQQQATTPVELFHGLASLQQSVSASLARLAALPAEMEGLLGELRPVLQRLQALAEARDLRQFLQRCWALHPAPEAMAADGALLRGLGQMLEAAPEIAAARAFLAAAEVGPDDEDLLIDRQTILEQLSLPVLARTPYLWASLRALWGLFRSRYQVVYALRHRACQEERRRLEALAREGLAQARALTRLNTISELGPPVDPEIAARWPFILTSLAPCSADPPPLGAGARCSQCGLSLASPPPSREFAEQHERLARALREQQQRLSARVIRQLLAQTGGEEVDRFVKVIQSSRLDPLAQVLDDRVVAFIKELLAAERRVEVSSPVLQELARRFGVVDEDQVDEVVQALAALLREGFAQAQALHPGKEVRLRLE